MTDSLSPAGAARPGGSREISIALEKGVGEYIASGAAPSAQEYLVTAYDLFAARGLRAGCRMALAKLARLANEHELREGFNRISARELTLDRPESRREPPAEQAHLWAQEIECWVAARPLLVNNRAVLRKLADTMCRSLQEIDIEWQAAPRTTLWRMAQDSDLLLKFAVSDLHDTGTEASEIALASHFLSDFAASLAGGPDVSRAPEGAAIRPLAYSPRAALDEFFDLSVPDFIAKIAHSIRKGDAEIVRQEGLALANSVGRLVCRLADPKQAAERLSTLLSGFGEWWKELRGTPPATLEAVRDALAESIVRFCDGFKFVFVRSRDADLLGRVAVEVETFLGSADLQYSKPPASSVAPLYLLASRAWERSAELEGDRYSSGQAFRLVQESLRLFIQQWYSPRMSVADAIDSLQRVKNAPELEPEDAGYFALARGNLAFRRGEYSAALADFKDAIGNLHASLSDPDRPGIKNLTILVARAHEDAAAALERMGDPACTSYLEGAARVLEAQARHFKVERSREELLRRAERYRARARHTAERMKSAPPEQP